MRKFSSLSNIHAEYTQGRMDRKILEGLIFQYLLDNFERYSLFGGDREKWADFVSWLYPRLSRAVDYYKETGASFDAYIGAIIQWSSKEYRIREAEHYAVEFTCWKARAEELAACSTEAEYFCEPDPEPKRLFPLVDIKPRHILILLLKSYFFVTDDFLDQVASATRVKKEKLREMMDKLREARSKREQTIRDLQQRIHNQYYRCLAFEKRLASVYEGTAKHAKIKACLERACRRYEAVKKRLNGLRKDATNQQVADILNIPRGTVDSALHTIREKWKQSPLAEAGGEGYHELCSATATTSTPGTPPTCLNT